MTTQELAKCILAIINETDKKTDIVGREDFWFSDALDGLDAIKTLCTEQLDSDIEGPAAYGITL